MQTAGTLPQSSTMMRSGATWGTDSRGSGYAASSTRNWMRGESRWRLRAVTHRLKNWDHARRSKVLTEQVLRHPSRHTEAPTRCRSYWHRQDMARVRTGTESLPGRILCAPQENHRTVPRVEIGRASCRE